MSATSRTGQVPALIVFKETRNARLGSGLWLGWACLTRKVPHAATKIATAFKSCFSHRKNKPLNRLQAKVSFPVFD
jgi:hypothetical protein